MPTGQFGSASFCQNGSPLFLAALVYPDGPIVIALKKAMSMLSTLSTLSKTRGFMQI